MKKKVPRDSLKRCGKFLERNTEAFYGERGEKVTLRKNGEILQLVIIRNERNKSDPVRSPIGGSYKSKQRETNWAEDLISLNFSRKKRKPN